MQGIHHLSAHAPKLRVSPARAGNTATIPGSAPRVRGTRSRSGPGRCGGGVSPARAGNTWARQGFRRVSPARAGNTFPRGGEVCNRPGQPRACGEHRCWSPHVGWPPGSAPRVRGTRRTVRADVRDRGVSPARAGNTLSHQRTYPTAAGEPPVPTLTTSPTSVTGSDNQSDHTGNTNSNNTNTTPATRAAVRTHFTHVGPGHTRNSHAYTITPLPASPVGHPPTLVSTSRTPST